MSLQTQIICSTPEAYRAVRKTWKHETVALVPTMGALHQGHLSLIKLARHTANRVVLSIFVNPLQFGPHEDFQRYPRTLDQDLTACEEAGADVVFAPDVQVMYPHAQMTQVLPPESLSQRLCGKSRPGHFTGVATVVLKLLHLIQPDVAIFGEKDAQQLAIIRRMVSDLNLPVKIQGAPIIREPSGLAMSSRNQYLTTPDEQQAALVLFRTLTAICDHATEVAHLPFFLGQTIASLPMAQQTLIAPEYLEAVNADTLEPASELSSGVRLIMAAKVGNVRLIDNMLYSGTGE